ncbi:DUF4062 domain-containing protein [Wenyingzhuangia aestuarii]|uniref:DUF4062 domain-containing protein n=1 Tax=Wenyingzhuangia aestuarii TaxID=1647582 RepID=UPI0014389FCC|nr:DUF4062 domain-containing protein [Wenyingzhuangia aestuarii]NJB84206.1 hypothetical protein [Wenyingzhuangia aestuarii]
MAKPKVFISSTCYDLGEIRDSLSTFVKSFGFEPVLSEYGDVFFHPDLHTHNACINEIGNCQLFILIIGGRFGGKYINDQKKSITNAEYESAVIKKVPIFTYIKKNVLDNHNLFQSNRNKDFVESIHYPAIEKQENAKSIFEFINRVRRSASNNGYESFENFRDIENHLRKQWAGMFFEFLKNREINIQISNTNESINEIKSVSNKLETILKNIYKVVDSENAESSIIEIDKISLASEYLERMIGEWQTGKIFCNEDEKERILNISPREHNWYEYLIEIGILEYVKTKKDDYVELRTPEHYDIDIPEDLDEFESPIESYAGLFVKKGKLINTYQIETNNMYENGIKEITNEIRKKLLSEYIIVE